jgi:hypothetical protein
MTFKFVDLISHDMLITLDRMTFKYVFNDLIMNGSVAC